jgi:conjugal transfer/type IV secretion protein DotA/TraY
MEGILAFRKGTDPMIGLFDIASNDQSVYYLTQIFGYVGTVLPANSATIFGTLFKTLNTTALILGSMMVIHTIILGLIKTAHEGEFLGKQWSSLWVPFRTVAGIAALFPTGSGYSCLQVAMMWFIIQGVGAADALWATVLNWVGVMGSPYSSMSAPTIGTTQSFQALFQALVCQAEAHRTDTDQTPATTPTNYYYCAQYPKSVFCQESASDILNITNITSDGSSQVSENTTTGLVIYKMGPFTTSVVDGACGYVQFPDPKHYVDPAMLAANNKLATPVVTNPICTYTDSASMLECAGITAQVPALQDALDTLGALAASIAEFDHEYMLFYNRGLPVPYEVPTFVSNYCATNNIPASSCCVFSASTSSCLTTSSNNAFPPIIRTTNNVTDMTNISVDGAQKIIWQFGIGPILGNVPDVIGTNVTHFAGTITAAITAAKLAQPANLKGWEADALATGWLLAGSYYYTIAGLSNSSQSASLPPLTVVGDEPVSSQNAMQNFRNNFNATTDILSAIETASRTTLSSSMPPAMASAFSTLNSTANSIANNFENNLTGTSSGTPGVTGNPMIQAQSFGQSLLFSAEVAYPVFLVIASAILVIASLNGMGLGSGPTISPAEAAVMFVVYGSWAVLMLYCGWCFTFGGMLAVYAPLVPYIIFTFGAIGWFAAVFEAMAAAPFVALGILSPNGQHEILGKAEPAMLILLNTFLRPSLMIMGMMAGMILVPQVVAMINSGFNAVMSSISTGSSTGPIEMILFITAYATLVITAMNKCFALIYLLPDKVLTWIGGHGGSAGEAESLQSIKSGSESTTGAIKKGASDAGSKTMGSAGKVKGPKKGGGAKTS